MPLLGFTKLKEKLLDGTKTQTIRKPRKIRIKEGDKLFIYWKLRTKECEKLGEAIVTKVETKRLANVNNEDAVKDGFRDLRNFLELFRMMHPKAKPTDWFDIITFEWTKKEWEA
jgi:hypothetical protein